MKRTMRRIVAFFMMLLLVININTFGKSGTPEEILQEFELDISSIIIKIKNNL